MGAQMTGFPHQNYDALTEISARTYGGKYAHSLKRVRVFIEISTRTHLSQKGAVQNSFCTAPALYLGVQTYPTKTLV